MKKSFFWFDLETFGTDPNSSWPAQFAGIRTDDQFNEINEPMNIFCQLPNDQIPDPQSVLVTGITPDYVNKYGLKEIDFFNKIRQQLLQPNTCAVGYNNIRFDDEFIRIGFYRNFFDPYEREYKDGNSRWDIIDLVRMTHALRPDGIQWPKNTDGYTSFKLEHLMQANQLDHGKAHDALYDVRATITLAKLIKKKQPKLFEFYFKNRIKNNVNNLIDLAKKTPLVHVSGMLGSNNNNIGIILPLIQHNTNKNEIIAYNLTIDPRSWLNLPITKIQDNLFTKHNKPRIPFKGLYINKCPALAPINVLRRSDLQRLQINLEQCMHYREILINHPKIEKLISSIFQTPRPKHTKDPDQMIYSGGFFSYSDKKLIERIHTYPKEQLKNLNLPFQDPRLSTMLFRFRARNYPETLSVSEKKTWKNHIKARLIDNKYNIFGLNYFNTLMSQLKKNEQSKHSQQLLNNIENYVSKTIT